MTSYQLLVLLALPGAWHAAISWKDLRRPRPIPDQGQGHGQQKDELRKLFAALEAVFIDHQVTGQ